ncbi:hypothetical protein KP509_16G016400 [Ceratopteris richardii]|uniref:Peroxisomal membrane protein PEX14 n=1 Tax=Ceratopteris richardii TaxID=49495 RepID=A0A8T2T131_CERRI|nr:hypothetical protein KP509_16G016400 [Ceratopteris richardii]
MGDDESSPVPTSVTMPVPASVSAPAPVSVSVPQFHPELPEKSRSSSVIKEVITSEEWPFGELQQIREDQVRNAVHFLSHPKVRESPVKHRYAFLERKGLTKAEIEEAFRRCPDPPRAIKGISPSEDTVLTVTPKDPSELYYVASVSAQTQPTLQYSRSAPLSVTQASSGSHWWQLIVGASLIAAASSGIGYFFQRIFASKLKTWYYDILLERYKQNDMEQGGRCRGAKLSPLEEVVAAATGAANAAAAAAAEVVNISHEVIRLQAEEWRHLRSSMKALDNKTEELKSTIMGMATVNEEDSSYHKGMDKVFQHTLPPAEEIHMKYRIQGCQGQTCRINSVKEGLVMRRKVATGVDEVQPDGQPTNFTGSLVQSEEPRWYSLPKQPAESNLQVNKVETGLNQEAGSTISKINENRILSNHQGWMPPAAPLTVNPAADSAIRNQKLLTKGVKYTTSSEGKLHNRPTFFKTQSLSLPHPIDSEKHTKVDNVKPILVMEETLDGGEDTHLEDIVIEEGVMTSKTPTEPSKIPEEPELAELIIREDIPVFGVDDAVARFATDSQLHAPNEQKNEKVKEKITIDGVIPSPSSKTRADNGV